MAITQISVFLENRAGQLSEITKILSDNNIDLKALNIAETADYGILRLISDDCNEAAKLLRNNGFIVTETAVVAAAVVSVELPPPHAVNESIIAAAIAPAKIRFALFFISSSPFLLSSPRWTITRSVKRLRKRLTCSVVSLYPRIIRVVNYC